MLWFSASMFQRLEELLSRGGPVMIPLLLLAFAMFWLSLDKVLMVIAEHRFDSHALAEVLRHQDSERMNRLRDLSRGFSAAPVRLVSRVFERDESGLGQAIDAAAIAERQRLGRFMDMIEVMTAIAPLLGLAGTVHGMILTFDAITSHGTSDASWLSRGISQALLSTQLGLTIALPGLVLSVALRSRIQRAQARVQVWAATLRGSNAGLESVERAEMAHV